MELGDSRSWFAWISVVVAFCSLIGEKGQSFHLGDKVGRTPLHAAARGQEAMMRLFLPQGKVSFSAQVSDFTPQLIGGFTLLMNLNLSHGSFIYAKGVASEILIRTDIKTSSFQNEGLATLVMVP
jgi:hypothetical protein